MAALLLTAAALGQVPSELERTMGKGLAADLERQWDMLADAQISDYVRTLAGKLAPRFPIQVGVIDRSGAKTIAFPGGFLYVSSGLVLKARNEAELAGALAHALGHIAAAAGIRTVMMGDSGLCTRFSESSLLPGNYLSTQRGFEPEADLLGIQYLSDAGYDPRGLLDFFERMKLEDGLSPEVHAKAAELSAVSRDYILTSSRFVNAQARLQALRPPRRRIPPSLRQ